MWPPPEQPFAAKASVVVNKRSLPAAVQVKIVAGRCWGGAAEVPQESCRGAVEVLQRSFVEFAGMKCHSQSSKN